MATEFYNLPTVNNEKNTFSFVDSVNGLATSIDETMEQMVDGFHAHPYHLPTATKQQLGGVRIGDGWDAYSDGEITPKDSKYILPKATNETLGGIIAGQNIICEEGKISLDEGAYKLDDYTTEMFRDGAVTTDKLADSSISSDQCAPIIPAQINKLVNAFNNWDRWRFTVGTGLDTGYIDILVFKFGGAYIVSTYSKGEYVSMSDGASFSITPESNFTSDYVTDIKTKMSELFPNTQSITVPLGLWSYGQTLEFDSYAYMEILPTQDAGYFHMLGKAKGATKIRGPRRAPGVRTAGVNFGSTIVFNEG